MNTKPPFLLAGLGITGGLFAWAVRFAYENGKLSSAPLVRDMSLAMIFIAIAVSVIYAITKSRSTESRLMWGLVGLVLLTADLGIHNAGSRLNAEAPELSPLMSARTAQRDPILQFLNTAGLSDRQTPYRVEIINAGALWANAPMIFGIQATQGYNPLRYALYDRIAGAQESFLDPRPFTAMTPGYKARLFNLLGVKYIASAEFLRELPSSEANQSGIALVRNDANKVWHNPEALPRIITATTIYIEPELERAIDEGRMARVDYFSTAVLPHMPSTLTDTPRLDQSPVMLNGQGEAKATIVAYRNTEVVVSVRSARDAILVLHDLYYPYWRVYVDDQERELLQANYLFRGVHVGAGEHTVVFRFEPFSWPAIQSTVRRLLR